MMRRLPLLPVAAMLQTQQTLTAVDRFVTEHDAAMTTARAQRYRNLIPLERPRSGQQYAFEVDLDACTGCKACVTACHSLNGLDETELWRTVGSLHGGTPAAPVVQTVTTSCHHCVEPACLLGCPVKAYEKDAVTGIVRHLEDQCFGCQYCTLMCPYDAPRYNARLGIVRKCDMCEGRLSHGEAPACVDACPNHAISIRVVSQAAVVERSDAGSFMPGAAAPEHTLPTTVYSTKKAPPGNMLPADFYRTSPEHSHPALVVMLTLTQLSAGAFALALFVEQFSGAPAGSPLLQAVFAGALAAIALLASLLHLGRPWLAWRAFLGFRTSWLSREAIAFALFALLAFLHGACASGLLGAGVPPAAATLVQSGAALAGAAGVFCSVMVYVATRRAQWSGARTGLKFFGTALVLGAATVLTVCASTAVAAEPFDRVCRSLFWLVAVVTGVKVAFDAGVLRYRRDLRQSVFKRTALVMLGELRRATILRFGLALAGGVIVPLFLASVEWKGRGVVPATIMMLALLTMGELTERYLFFRTAPASRMPGGIR
jgi:Fe-S-cluster-containing dehydrogenase component/DMSO reductase anchor subunit